MSRAHPFIHPAGMLPDSILISHNSLISSKWHNIGILFWATVVVYKGLIANQMVCNPHYFASLCFDQFKAHAFLLMLNEPQNITQHPIFGKVSKKIHTEYWKQKDLGKHKKKAKNLWPGAVSGTTRTSGNSGTSGSTSFSVIDYLYQSFVVDDIFSDLL